LVDEDVREVEVVQVLVVEDLVEDNDVQVVEEDILWAEQEHGVFVDEEAVFVVEELAFVVEDEVDSVRNEHLELVNDLSLQRPNSD
jgi:hypothetical protein